MFQQWKFQIYKIQRNAKIVLQAEEQEFHLELIEPQQGETLPKIAVWGQSLTPHIQWVDQKQDRKYFVFCLL